MAVLDWCLQNFLPLRQAGKGLVVATYEQLVLRPDPALRLLAEYLDLESVDKMIAAIARPSGSVSKSGAETASFLSETSRNEDRKWLVEKWRSRIGENQEESLMKIVTDFGIDIYRAGESTPTSAYWL
jgi:hypothetical protein